MAKVLLYNINEPDENEVITRLCAVIGAEPVVVPADRQYRTIGSLCSNPSICSLSESDSFFSGKMMVMHSLNSHQMDFLLDNLKKQNVTGILKAVVTETNMNWSGIKLYQELCREHEYFRLAEKKGARKKTVHKKRK